MISDYQLSTCQNLYSLAQVALHHSEMESNRRKCLDDGGKKGGQWFRREVQVSEKAPSM